MVALLPIIVVYPLLFGWVSYQTATKLAEHKRRLQVMSTRDGMTACITDVIGKLCYAMNLITVGGIIAMQRY